MAVPAMAIGVTNWAASTTGSVAPLGGAPRVSVSVVTVDMDTPWGGGRVGSARREDFGMREVPPG
ncbi:hypothetical protein IFM12275_08220 [Nocardia sputorum]|uniref:Uncharacterized protein n=1 Tax=Nocardia sputorum TaxID=2984338 RepID=A0ABM8CWV5_9NOCA|nr:hypothetical protein IFM12275_08220 [Nocardia sputorum]BDT99475.1 hypothetical protein IFM12276_25040 [Nocardia sputorum]